MAKWVLTDNLIALFRRDIALLIFIIELGYPFWISVVSIFGYETAPFFDVGSSQLFTTYGWIGIKHIRMG